MFLRCDCFKWSSMMRRRDFAMAGIVALAAASAGRTASAQAGVAKAEHREHDAQMQACAKACADCQLMCDMCSTHCSHLLAEGKKEHLATLMSCQDCADICTAAAQSAARGGPHAAHICEACATVCAGCAKECERYPDDEEMTKCAKECRKCEKACKAMASHAGHTKK
jgi:hypothetical protein